ncbi:hypothetical protein PAL_GLEAN10024730 [Pteropus alecto]|uniref:Uncharacterized protein n=1 Tax=Pteropus alecto TaxID=9402 RepID=L5K101_PTEAL|nr:hypothetical protein PAL_GLEAN10024730 [Pteropus alecto]
MFSAHGLDARSGGLSVGGVRWGGVTQSRAMLSGGRVRKERAARGPYGFSVQCLHSAEGVSEKAARLSAQGGAAPAEKG